MSIHWMAASTRHPSLAMPPSSSSGSGGSSLGRRRWEQQPRGGRRLPVPVGRRRQRLALLGAALLLLLTGLVIPAAGARSAAASSGGGAGGSRSSSRRRALLPPVPSASSRRLVGVRGGASAGAGADGAVAVVGDETLERARLLRRRPRVLLQAALLGLLALGLLASLGKIAAVPQLAPITITVTAAAEAVEAASAAAEAAGEGGGGVGVGESVTSASLPALLLLALGAAANLLFWLAQRWSLPFRVWAGYGPARVPAEASAVLVLPKPHKGAAALLPVTRSAAATADEAEEERGSSSNHSRRSSTKNKKGKGKGKKAAAPASVPAFVYQHRTYTLGRAGFKQLSPSLRLPLREYLEAPGPFVGKGGGRKADAARALYGPNRLDVAVPSLKSLVVEEALSPVSVLKLLDLALAAADR